MVNDDAPSKFQLLTPTLESLLPGRAKKCGGGVGGGCGGWVISNLVYTYYTAAGYLGTFTKRYLFLFGTSL